MRLHIPVTLRWSDLDAYGHVNNVEMLRLVEEARITALWRHEEAEHAWPTAVLDTGPQATSHTFVARQEVEYLRPLEFTRSPLRVDLWFGRLGGASAEICYEVRDGEQNFPRTGLPTDGAPYARVSTIVVVVDAASGAPRRLSPEERAAWEPFVEESITFRRR